MSGIVKLQDQYAYFDEKEVKALLEKLEKDQYCELTKEQAALYQNVVDNTMEAIEQADGINRRGLVLKLIEDKYLVAKQKGTGRAGCCLRRAMDRRVGQ